MQQFNTNSNPYSNPAIALLNLVREQLNRQTLGYQFLVNWGNNEIDVLAEFQQSFNKMFCKKHINAIHLQIPFLGTLLGVFTLKLL